MTIHQHAPQYRPNLGRPCMLVLSLMMMLVVHDNVVVKAQNLDRFNYDATKKSGTSNDYGPSDWQKIVCPNVDTCIGYPDKFRSSQGWEITTKNFCIWCPDNGKPSCGTQHNSPINLDRNVAIPSSGIYNECIDGHWMAYFDSSCSYDELKTKNAFVIDRHTLKIIQPIAGSGDDHNHVMKLDCQGQPGAPGRWGRIDFPKGYSDWWYLSHIDFKVPSEHHQNNQQYAGELQMYHFYSVSPEQAGIHNEMGTVSMFLQDYSGSADWDVLNKIICAWREAEEKNRAACGLPSVKTQYNGCTVYNRLRRKLRQYPNLTMVDDDTLGDTPPAPKRPLSAHDIIIENFMNEVLGNASYQPKRLLVEDHNNFAGENDATFNWESLVAEHSQSEDSANNRSRQLIDYSDVPWFNYFPNKAVKTEYFFRYSGTQTVPPCYGTFVPGPDNRKQTNAWRVMKDPIRVSTRQINEMHRLLKERIAPKGDPVNSCKPDTAAKIVSSTRVDVSRPLQKNNKAHFTVFCECINWKSKFVEDQNWCKNKDLKNRLLDNPYNFGHSGF